MRTHHIFIKSSFMSYLSVSNSFEHLCYGSRAVINILIISSNERVRDNISKLVLCEAIHVVDLGLLLKAYY